MTKSLIQALLLSALFMRCGEPAPPVALTKALAEVQQQHCPDRRVCIWDLEVSARSPWVLKGATNLPEGKTALLQRIEAAGIPFIDSIRLLPDPALEGQHFALVSLSVGNIRTQPKHSAELATQAVLGTPLTVFEQQGEWFRVQTPDLYIGWIDQGGLYLQTEERQREWRSAEKVIVTAEFGSVHLEPAPESPTVSDVVMGSILVQEGSKGDYFMVEFPDGRTGFLSTVNAQPFEEWLAMDIPAAVDLLGTARSLLGRPYLWGGTSTKGMDCSGFTKTVYFRHGWLLPRDASQQVQVGMQVPTDSTFSQLQAGDLLFFGRMATEELPEKVTHVAIYLGAGEFIHASGQVKVESLFPEAANFSEYRRSTFLRAKRILDPQNPAPSLRVKETEAFHALEKGD